MSISDNIRIRSSGLILTFCGCSMTIPLHLHLLMGEINYLPNITSIFDFQSNCIYLIYINHIINNPFVKKNN